MVFHDREQVEQAIDNLLQVFGEIGEHLAQPADHTFFVVRVHENRAGIAKALDQGLRQRPHRRLARQVEKLFMPHALVRAVVRAVVDVARPLHRYRGIRPGAGPDGDGGTDGLEVEVVTRVRQ